MIFQHTHHLIGHGKTQTTRLAAKYDIFVVDDAGRATGVYNAASRRWRWRIGRTYAVQPGRGKKAVGRIRVTAIGRVENPMRVGYGYARDEGFKSVAAWREKCYFIQCNSGWRIVYRDGALKIHPDLTDKLRWTEDVFFFPTRDAAEAALKAAKKPEGV